MDYVVPALLFAIGFGGALIVRRLVSMGARRDRSNQLPVKKGAVRLDAVGKKKRKR